LFLGLCELGEVKLYAGFKNIKWGFEGDGWRVNLLNEIGVGIFI
jgi:hypothetical protein